MSDADSAEQAAASRGERPYRRCPEFDCSYVERAMLTMRRQPRRWWQAAARISPELRWSATRCPLDGHELVRQCENHHLLLAPDDEYCRECGRPYWWVVERRRGSTLNENWRAAIKPTEVLAQDVRVYLVRHSIAHIRADALISTDDQFGAMRGGSAAALKREGGDEIEQESMTGRHDLGDAWVTNAGRLTARYVIHVAIMDSDDKTSADTIAKAMRNSLAQAEKQAQPVREIVYPALGTGRSHFEMDASAAIMRAELVAHVDRTPATSLEAVVVALFSPDDFRDFNVAYERVRAMVGETTSPQDVVTHILARR